MSNALLTTKLYFPPPRPGLVPRPRLIERLQIGLQTPLTLISALAGAGKTTLLGQWRLGRGSGTPVAWLSLDSADNDPARFLQYLSAALDTLEPGLEEEARSVLQSAEPLNGEAVLILLINRLSGLKEDAVLALDDFHLIENPYIHTALTFLVEHLPPRLHLVLLSRADPPLPLARLRARGQMVEIRSADLRFSLEECALFLNQVMDLDLNGEQVSALEKHTEGWVAGLQLAALSMYGREDVDGFVSAFTGSNRYIADFLVEEILTRQPEPLRQFLLKTSILDRMTGPLCDALTGEQEGEEFLKQLEYANLFVIPLDDEQRWYRYHHLFSDLLRLLLEQDHPGLSIELHRRACRWYEAQGMLSEALNYAIASGDIQLVAQIVSANVLVLLENDEVAPTLRKIDALPSDEMSAMPWLGIARAWVLGAGQIQKVHQVLDAVEKHVENAPESAERQRLKGHIAAVRTFVFSVQGDKANAVAHAREANAQLPADEIAVRAINLALWGDVMSADGHDPNAMPILEQAWALALQTQKPHVAMTAAATLASAHLGAGRLHEVHRVCVEALTLAEDYQKRYQRSLSAAANIYPLLARVLAEWGEYEAAAQAARKGLLLSEHWGQVDTDVTGLHYLGRALAFGNDWGQARDVFRRANVAAQKISPWFWQINTTFTLESMLDFEAPDAGEVAQQIRRVQESGASYPALLAARLLLRDNQPHEALLVLEQALADLQGKPSFDIVRIHALRALALQGKGDEKSALETLRQALELAEPENRVATFVREGSAMEKLLRRTHPSEFVQHLLTAFENRRKPKPTPVPVTEALIEPLSQREIEVLKLLARGCSDKKIAEILIIARGTVHKHLKNIYSKLDVHSRTEAIVRARELGLL